MNLFPSPNIFDTLFNEEVVVWVTSIVEEQKDRLLDIKELFHPLLPILPMLGREVILFFLIIVLVFN